MLNIKNIQTIKSVGLVIRGVVFVITRIEELENRYSITLQHHGTAYSPIDVILERNSTNCADGMKRYALYKPAYMVGFLKLEELRTHKKFLKLLEEYLNGL